MSSDNPYDPFGFGGYTAEAMNRAGSDASVVAKELRGRVESAFESESMSGLEGTNPRMPARARMAVSGLAYPLTSLPLFRAA